jgi:hypothetical protein
MYLVKIKSTENLKFKFSKYLMKLIGSPPLPQAKHLQIFFPGETIKPFGDLQSGQLPVKFFPFGLSSV